MENKQKSSQKRTNYLSWTDYFLSLTQLIAQRSKDPNTQVGAVIVNPQTKTIVATGYNGFPRGCNDDEFPWSNDSENWLETKYSYVVHAEANAIIHAQQNCAGFHLYTNFFPCHECTKLIIQAGIRTVYYLNIFEQDRWQDSHKASERMYKAAGIDYKKIER